MSLDVHLTKTIEKKCPHCGGVVKTKTKEVYWANITHNLGAMADNVSAGHSTLYYYLWRPEEIAITKASELVYPLTIGLAKLKDNPEYYKMFNAANGWGLYEHLVPFVEEYLNACIENPECTVYATR